MIKTKETVMKAGQTIKERKDPIKLRRQRHLMITSQVKSRIPRENLGFGEAEEQNQDGAQGYAVKKAEDSGRRAAALGRQLMIQSVKARRKQQKQLIRDQQAGIFEQDEQEQTKTVHNVYHEAQAPIAAEGIKTAAKTQSRTIQKENSIRKYQRKKYVQRILTGRQKSAGISFRTESGEFEAGNIAPASEHIAGIGQREAQHNKRKKAAMKAIRTSFPLAAGIFILLLVIVLMFAGTMALHGEDNGNTVPENGTIVEVAKSQVGNIGGRPYWSWYGFAEHVDWCACFVSWCADQCGYLEADAAPKFSYCQDGVNWFISHEAWYSGSISPKPGMIIFFDWDGNGTADHVGIVESCKDSVVHTIEGNSGDACKTMWYPVGSSVIYGYGLIAEATETESKKNKKE